MKKKEIFVNLIKRLKAYRMKLVTICITFIIMTVCSFLYPIIVRNITDEGMLEKNFQKIIFYSACMFGVLIFEQLVSIYQTQLSLSIKNQFQKNLFEDAFTKLLYLKMEYFKDKNSAEIINKLSTDINSVTMIADKWVINIVNYLLRLVSGSIGLFVIDKRLAVAVLIFAPLKMILVTKTSKKKEKYTCEYIEISREFSSWFADTVNGINEIKLWNLYETKKIIFNNKQEKIIKLNVKTMMMDAYNDFGDVALNAILTSALYAIGGLMICQGALSIGSVMAFISYSMYVTGPIATLLNMKYIFAGIVPSAERLFEFLDLEEEKKEKGALSLEKFQNIRLKDVSFSYDNKQLLQKINMKINRGDKIAIIGCNGSGKTTVIKLLLQLITPVSGNIILNDKNIEDYDLNDYRNRFAVVSQEIYLFQDTIFNNISMSMNHTQEEVLVACEKSCLQEFLNDVPKGLNGMVEKNGTNISGGEKRKIALARALIKDSEIIILDEASANLDVNSNNIMYRNLMTNFVDKTVIFITHDYASLNQMDQVFKLENGVLSKINNLDKYIETTRDCRS